jgi:hypothetical protein
LSHPLRATSGSVRPIRQWSSRRRAPQPGAAPRRPACSRPGGPSRAVTTGSPHPGAHTRRPGGRPGPRASRRPAEQHHPGQARRRRRHAPAEPPDARDCHGAGRQPSNALSPPRRRSCVLALRPASKSQTHHVHHRCTEGHAQPVQQSAISPECQCFTASYPVRSGAPAGSHPRENPWRGCISGVHPVLGKGPLLSREPCEILVRSR